MLSFLLTIRRLFTGIFHAFARKEFQVLFLLVLIILTSGTIFYSTVEGFSVVDALYFSVTTLATVGSGDLAPQTNAGKLFAILYIFAGTGVVFAVIGQIAYGVFKSKKSR